MKDLASNKDVNLEEHKGNKQENGLIQLTWKKLLFPGKHILKLINTFSCL